MTSCALPCCAEATASAAQIKIARSDVIREQDARDREDKILLHRPRVIHQPSEPADTVQHEARKAM